MAFLNVCYRGNLVGKTYKNTYDRDGRVTRQAMITGGEYVYFYDPQNRLVRVTDNLGAEVKYTYNSIGKRTEEKRKINGEETQYIKYAYDAAGRLRERAEKRNPKRNRKWWAITSYAYDGDGNITEIQLPDGSKMQHHRSRGWQWQ